jgi:hypothetical protein
MESQLKAEPVAATDVQPVQRFGPLVTRVTDPAVVEPPKAEAPVASPSAAPAPAQEEEKIPDTMTLSKPFVWNGASIKELKLDPKDSMNGNDYFKLLADVERDSPGEFQGKNNRRSNSDFFVMAAIAKINGIPVEELRASMTLGEVEGALLLGRFFLRRR